MAECKFRAELTLTRRIIVSCDTCGKSDFSDSTQECRENAERFEKQVRDSDPFSCVTVGMTRG